MAIVRKCYYLKQFAYGVVMVCLFAWYKCFASVTTYKLLLHKMDTYNAWISNEAAVPSSDNYIIRNPIFIDYTLAAVASFSGMSGLWLGMAIMMPNCIAPATPDSGK